MRGHARRAAAAVAAAEEVATYLFVFAPSMALPAQAVSSTSAMQRRCKQNVLMMVVLRLAL